ncbi:MAG: hypothetical protein ACXWHI_02980, partial [Candidatus Aminicenantales bacterium]
MRKTILVLAVFVALIVAPAAPGKAEEAARARDVLPAEGLVPSSIAAIRDQATLNAHYYLADET